MNRRTFLQFTGMTALLTTVPTLFAEKENNPKWINVKDQLPPMNQKFIMIEIWNDKIDYNVSIREENKTYELYTKRLFELYYCRLQYEINGWYICSHMSKKETMKYVNIAQSWINEDITEIDIEPVDEKNISIDVWAWEYLEYIYNTYWMPIEGEYPPKKLPTMPKYETFQELLTERELSNE